MIVLDSSCWLEHAEGSSAAKPFMSLISDPKQLYVPTIILFEVAKKMKMERGDRMANRMIALMRKGAVVNLDEDTSLFAAHLSLVHKLALADSIILATAHRLGAELWTMDADFEGVEGVNYIERGRSTPTQ
jgi:toxin FitB